MPSSAHAGNYRELAKKTAYNLRNIDRLVYTVLLLALIAIGYFWNAIDETRQAYAIYRDSD